MAIYNTAITATLAASANILASGSGNRAITTIIICNANGATDKTVTLYACPSTNLTASSSNMIVNALNVPAGDTVSFDQEKMVLSTSDEIKAICSAAGLTATVSTLAV
jgi:membrane-bound inhibitor of C-type lysozyme